MSASAPRVAIVTGAAAGIGRACVRRLAADGYQVLAADRDLAGAAALAAAAPDQVVAQVCDVAEADHCERLAEIALDRWGRIDVAVANAGVQTPGRLLDMAPEDRVRVWQVNVEGVAATCRAVLPAMIAQGDGRLVLISSINAARSPPAMAYYDASKHAVIGLMRAIAVDHGADGVRANAICPGATLTDHHLRAAAARGQSADDLRCATQGYGLLGRVAEPEEIASVVAFLAGPDSSFVTGATLMVDGGASVKE